MDLKEYKRGEIYFLHLIDMATRFSRSCILKSKDPKVIVEKILEIWLGTGIGAPEKFLCDNGGEFANKTFLELCENMNIRVMHTAAYSPFSNGLCERNHTIIDDSVSKIMAEQPDCSLKVALAWAVNAKNCLHMVGGYSPYQLVFGRNPKLPCAISDNPPALEGTTSSEVIAKHLNASHSARKAFMAAEASEKIRRALKHQIRPTGRVFSNGELVYFKREDTLEWKGPATVIGHDGKTVILKYGSNIVRVHETRIKETAYNFNSDIENGRRSLIDLIKERRKESEANKNELDKGSKTDLGIENKIIEEDNYLEEDDSLVEAPTDNVLDEVPAPRRSSRISCRMIGQIIVSHVIPCDVMLCRYAFGGFVMPCCIMPGQWPCVVMLCHIITCNVIL